MTRGEVWWYEHPDASRRPFVILTRNEACAVLNQVLAAPATSVIRGIPTEVAVDRDDGLPRSCAFALDNVTVIRPSLCTERITTLNESVMHRICEALRHAINC